MGNIIITTTNQIENATIEKYFGVITSNIVVGTNLFSDFAASFTDFFGGNSGTYQRKLQLIYKEAMNDLSAKSITLGANCILGLHIDFDEISGKGKSMFMVSLMGTAVKIDNKQKESGIDYIDVISAEYLMSERLKRKYLQRFAENHPTSEDWEYILSHDMPELADVLYKAFISSNFKEVDYEAGKVTQQNFPIYLSKLDYDKAVKVVYADVETAPRTSSSLIKNLNLFHAASIFQLIKKNRYDIAIGLLDSDKATYTKDDLLDMKAIVEDFNNLPNVGSIQMVKGGLLQKDSEKYICPNGHKNPSDTDFCIECGKNIKGLTQREMDAIADFAEKVEVLDQILSSKC